MFNVVYSDVDGDLGEQPVIDFHDSSLSLLRERERVLVAALKHYANRENWASCKQSLYLKHYRGFPEHGWELAESALKELGL